MFNYLTISQLVYFFVFYSFFGWFIETLYLSLFLERKFIDTGFLFGPFCPIYSFGIISLIILLNPFINYPLLFTLGAIIITSIIEYITGFILESIFKTKWWDYSDKKFNLHGRICLKFSLYWGVLSTFAFYFIHPSVNITTNKIINTFPSYFIYFIILYFLIDFSLTINSLVNLKIIYLKLKKIRDKYEQDLTEFKKEHLSSFDFDDIKENFQQKQNKVFSKLKKRYKRLPKAFPSIHKKLINLKKINY